MPTLPESARRTGAQLGRRAAVPHERERKDLEAMTPCARSMKMLKDRSYIVAKVEQRLQMPNAPFPITRDAFGFGDLLVAAPGIGIFLVQVTSTANLNAREKKARGIPELRTWLESGGRFWLHGWSKKGPRGKRKTWQLSVREITIEDLQG
jgi:hypothetical protein